jgi:hypothetical protein
MLANSPQSHCSLLPERLTTTATLLSYTHQCLCTSRNSTTFWHTQGARHKCLSTRSCRNEVKEYDNTTCIQSVKLRPSILSVLLARCPSSCMGRASKGEIACKDSAAHGPDQGSGSTDQLRVPPSVRLGAECIPSCGCMRVGAQHQPADGLLPTVLVDRFCKKDIKS